MEARRDFTDWEEDTWEERRDLYCAASEPLLPL